MKSNKNLVVIGKGFRFDQTIWPLGGNIKYKAVIDTDFWNFQLFSKIAFEYVMGTGVEALGFSIKVLLECLSVKQYATISQQRYIKNLLSSTH